MEKRGGCKGVLEKGTKKKDVTLVARSSGVVLTLISAGYRGRFWSPNEGTEGRAICHHVNAQRSATGRGVSTRFSSRGDHSCEM